MRPPPPWSFASLRTLKAFSRRPRVAATPAVTKATGSAPMVSPPIAVASSGTTESTASATSSMASGRQTVCLESMNQLLLRPDLRVKSPVLTECASRWARQLGEGVSRAHRNATPAPPATTAPMTEAGCPACSSARRASPTEPASMTSAMPTPRLKTRSISSSATEPNR